MSSKSTVGALEDAGGSWLGFVIFILIWIWSLVFHTTIFQIWAFYLDFEDAKKFHVLEVQSWSFGSLWMFLTWIWHLDLDLDMVTGL